ncbi:MAG: imidazolonepropionase [Thermoplasmata archaeon]|uniref:Imidazolonepropionase n=1 Tax=Candidatus Sysuiplasma superficiale TaxID=2823368 RepID=A0A8J8CAM8_9ARCH|nr:imidazolonepropionase [Candidatus Sysuiplasma superficiale]MBX8643670.1 imidazolonepropionase [Candidatus Sysuiplasma superficiale]
MKADLLIECGQMVTPSGSGPKCGEQMNDLLVVDGAAIAVREGNVIDFGRKGEMENRYGGKRRDVGDSVVCPAFVDCHSHVVFSGSRENELSRKLRGATYMEILREGGGILSTVRSSRAADETSILRESMGRAAAMLRNGVTCLEAKSGYGLNLEQELKLLRVAGMMNSGLQRVVPVYLGAHAIPPERSREEYVDEIVKKHLPAVIEGRYSGICDIFVEEGAFTPDDAVQILLSAKKLGFAITAHVDEFKCSGAAETISSLGASSLSHLAHTPRSSFSTLAENGTIGIILPSTPLFSMSRVFPDASGMVSEGMAIAVGTDLSPNSWNESMMLSALLSVYDCGLSQEAAITATTLNAACAIGVAGERGSIEKGKRADILCLDIDSYRKMFYRHSDSIIKHVYSGGMEVFSPSSA